MSELPGSEEQIEFEKALATYDNAADATGYFSAAESWSDHVIHAFKKVVRAHPELFSYFYSYLVAKTSMSKDYSTPFGGRAFTEMMRDLCVELGLTEEGVHFQTILDTEVL